MTKEVNLIEHWLSAYQRLDHAAMATCYHDHATFEDIAFRLRGKSQIHAMWHLICSNGVQVIENVPPKTTGTEVVLKVTDKYIFSSTQRIVVNPITCRFRFRDELIIEHRDECDAKSWSRQAIGGLKGWFAGRSPFLRRKIAQYKLSAFIALHPEYSVLPGNR